jgi:L-lactate dehydrogenase
MDLMHGQAFVGRVRVRAGDAADLAESRVVIVCAGVGQGPGESRLDLMGRNVDVFRSVAADLDRHAPDAVVVVATNPVDVLTYVLQELSERPVDRIIGTGTSLDSSRLRALVAEHLSVDPRSVHGYVLGEHGDSEVAIWSSATIGGASLLEELGDPARARRELDAIAEQVRCAAADIIDRKGFTNTAIGLVLANIVHSIVDDQRTVLPVSVRLEGELGIEDVCLSVPCIVGAGGAGPRMLPPLDDDELAAMQSSGAVLRASLDELGELGAE